MNQNDCPLINFPTGKDSHAFFLLLLAGVQNHHIFCKNQSFQTNHLGLKEVSVL